MLVCSFVRRGRRRGLVRQLVASRIVWLGDLISMRLVKSCEGLGPIGRLEGIPSLCVYQIAKS